MIAVGIPEMEARIANCIVEYLGFSYSNRVSQTGVFMWSGLSLIINVEVHTISRGITSQITFDSFCYQRDARCIIVQPLI
jgi:hypothetical protein